MANLGDYLRSKLDDIKNRILAPKMVSPVPDWKQPYQPSMANQFWTGPIGQGLANIQNKIQTGNIVPQFQPFKSPGLPSSIGNFVANVPGGMVNTIYGKGITQPTADVTNLIKRTVQGQNITPYNDLFSSQARLGYNISGMNATPKQVAGNIAGSILPPLTAWAPTGATGVAKEGLLQAGKTGFVQAVKQGALDTGIMGGAYGLTSGLAENRNTQNNVDYLKNVGVQTVGGVTVGALMGGVISGSSYALGQLRNVAANAYQKSHPAASPQETLQATDQWIRNDLGQFVGKRKPQTKEPVYYGDLRESLGLPRTGIEGPKNRAGYINLKAKVGGEQPILKPSKLQTKSQELFPQPQETIAIPTSVSSSEIIPQTTNSQAIKDFEKNVLNGPSNTPKIAGSEAKNIGNVAQINQIGNKPAFIEAVKKYFGKIEAAKTQGTEMGAKIRTLPRGADPKEIIRAIENPEAKVTSEVQKYISDFRSLDNKVFSQAKDAGIDVNYLRDHISHFWANSPQEVEQAYARFSKSFGGAKHRQIPTYEEGIALGLKPRYNNPAQILAESYKRLQQTTAGLEAFTELKNKGFIVPASIGRSTPGFSPISAPGFPSTTTRINDQTAIMGKWFAPTEFANIINRAFSPQDYGVVGKIAGATGRASSLIQDVTMSGGLPYTPANAFTFANVLKEAMALRPVEAAKAFFTSDKFFETKAPVIARMQQNDIPVNTNFNIENLAPQGNNAISAVSHAIKGQLGEAGADIGRLWNNAVNNPTFKRFMPALQVQLFEDTEKAALAKGLSMEEASAIAAKAVKNFYGTKGIYAQNTSDRLVEDISRTFLFSPKFREAMINFWVNNVKALRHPLALENRANIAFIGSAIATYLAYDKINQASTGKHLYQNPPSTEDKALIPLQDGNVLGIPYLSSIATVPRGLYRVGNKLIKGDISGAAGETFKTFGSTLLKTAGEVATNEDYFGKPIVSPTDEPLQRLAKTGAYVAGNLSHPYIKELTDPRNTEDPAYQRVSRALELPARYYTPQNLANKYFYGFRDDLLSPNAAGYYPKAAGEIRKNLVDKKITPDEARVAMQRLADEQKARDAVKKTGQVQTANDKVFYQDKYGDVRSIPSDGATPSLKLSGQADLDKQLISQRNSQITSQIGDITKLYGLGLMTADQANQKIAELKALKISAPKKPKKISIKTPKLKSFKIPKVKKAKVTKLKAIKFKKIKPFKIAKPVKLKVG